MYSDSSVSTLSLLLQAGIIIFSKIYSLQKLNSKEVDSLLRDAYWPYFQQKTWF